MGSPIPPHLDSAITPLGQLEEASDAYHLALDVPGVERDDLEVELAGRRLTVVGDRRGDDADGTPRRRTGTTRAGGGVGRFHSQVVLPEDVDDGDASARLVDGVLTVRVPKARSARQRHIEVR